MEPEQDASMREKKKSILPPSIINVRNITKHNLKMDRGLSPHSLFKPFDGEKILQLLHNKPNKIHAQTWTLVSTPCSICMNKNEILSIDC